MDEENNPRGKERTRTYNPILLPEGNYQHKAVRGIACAVLKTETVLKRVVTLGGINNKSALQQTSLARGHMVIEMMTGILKRRIERT
jgi:hypothetical protein